MIAADLADDLQALIDSPDFIYSTIEVENAIEYLRTGDIEKAIEWLDRGYLSARRFSDEWGEGFGLAELTRHNFQTIEAL